MHRPSSPRLAAAAAAAAASAACLDTDTHLLEGHEAVAQAVARLVHHAIRAFPQLGDLLVAAGQRKRQGRGKGGKGEWIVGDEGRARKRDKGVDGG